MHPVDEVVGKRIRTRRNLIDITQIELADKIGVTFQQVQKYERGANRVSASRLVEIAVALDVPITYFFDGVAVGGDSRIIDFCSSPDGARLIAAVLRLRGDPMRKAIIEMVEAVANEVDSG